jgi:hypothetical protein
LVFVLFSCGVDLGGVVSILRRTSSGFGGGASSGWGVFGVFMGLYIIDEVDPLDQVTGEMVDAGVLAYELGQGVSAKAALVESIFYAMLEARRIAP